MPWAQQTQCDYSTSSTQFPNLISLVLPRFTVLLHGYLETGDKFSVYAQPSVWDFCVCMCMCVCGCQTLMLKYVFLNHCALILRQCLSPNLEFTDLTKPAVEQAPGVLLSGIYRYEPLCQSFLMWVLGMEHKSSYCIASPILTETFPSPMCGLPTVHLVS